MMEIRRDVVIEAGFLLLLFGALVYLGPGEVFERRLVNDKPVHFGAGDGYLYAMFSNWVYDQGDFRNNPPYGSAGFNDTIAYHPPMLPVISAGFAHTAGLHGHDALPLLMALFVLFGAFMMYWFVRSYNRAVAVLGSSLFVFLYMEKFIFGYVWGQALLHLGAFLVIALYFLTGKDLKYWWVPAGILIAALINAHPPEMFFFYGYIAFFLGLKFIFRQLTRKELLHWAKQLTLATILGVVLGFNFLVIFYNGYYDPGEQLRFTTPMKPEEFGAVRVPPVYDFHWPVLAAIFAGVVLAIVLARKNVHPALAAGGYMFLVGLSNYVGLVGFFYRAFQTRFIWPAYLAGFFGLTLYFVTKKFTKNLLIAAVISLVVGGVLVNQYYQPTRSDIIGDGQWQGIEWLYDNTPKDARVLFLYGDGYSQWIRLIKRLNFMVVAEDYVKMAQEGKPRRIMMIEPMLQNDMFLMHRTGLFTFGRYAKEQNITVYPGLFDVCEFDYYVVDRVSGYAPQLVQVNVWLANIFAQHNMTLAYQNDHVAILKNNNVRGECLA